MKKSICSWIMILTVSLNASGHNSILPQPQKIVYGKAQLPIKGIYISFISAPGVEDRFAAQELAVILSKITSTDILVKDFIDNSPSIILERTGDVDPLPLPDEKAGPGSRESYKILITNKNVRIIAKSSAGLFYAVQTLRQMIEGEGDRAFLPEAEIEDWPSLAYRGFMMDMSHTQLPTIQEIKQQIDFLARWKTNQYLFYSEASIELDGYPLLMANARFTRQQVIEIIEYAKERHVDVIPNMELYGHLHDLFRLEHYADLSVIPHGGEFKPEDPRVKPLLEDWIAQISSLFPSPFFHIGFDETWLLEVEAKKINKNPEELYLEMMKQTTEIVEKHGKRPLAWADMLQKYPAIIPKISPKVVAVPWHYEPLTGSEYEKVLSPFSKAGIPMIVQGAIINWNWLVPAFEISFKNTDLLIEAGRKYNTIGFINSGWTDDVLNLMRLGFPDMAYGSVSAWQSKPIDQDNFFKIYASAQYPPALALKVGKGLQSLREAESLLRKSFGPTDPAFWANPFTPKNLKLAEDNKENLRKGRLAAEDAQVYLMEALKHGTDTVTLFTTLVGAKMLDYLALKYIYADEIAQFWRKVNESSDKSGEMQSMYMEILYKYHTRTSDMLDAITELKELFKKAWLMEYTDFRLGIAIGKYDEEFRFWLKFQRGLEEVHQNYVKGDVLPSLESIVK
ncbi:MAG: beta-N-acetylhexosaminidase [Chitinophagaceae bacterium]